MISKPLIDLLNSGEAVSILGSGISVEAGVPTWDSLFNSVAAALDSEKHDTQRARATARAGRLPEAFDYLARQTTKSDIHARITALVGQVSTPGVHHTQLADWPFRFHITTNYDHLIEDASLGRLAPVGNSGSELYKVAGGSRDFVWHLHGGCRLSSDRSHLVVAHSDYDNFYPNSNIVDRLKASAIAYRCVFIGFGFNDKDLTRVIQTVGRLTHSGLPSYAFIGYQGNRDEARQHQDLLRSDYNIEAIPYFTQDGNHADLKRVLETYAPFVLRHSLSLTSANQPPPTYDKVASSLIVQSRLDIGMLASSASLKKTLIGARILAHIRDKPGGHDDSLEPVYHSGQPSQSEVRACVATLRQSGAVTSSPLLDLTPEYLARIDTAEAQLELTRDKFCRSLRARVLKHNSDFDEPALGRVTDAGSAFFDKLCRERGLGVAQNLATSSVSQASLRTVSLVQHLPEYVAACTTRDEAFAVVHLAVDVLTRPTEAETIFLGLLCQAYFGQHLIGASETLAKVDLDLISDTCYVLDASVLVCLLAEGSDTHEFATRLVSDLVTNGAILTTTSLFVQETAEHARWAISLIERYGEHSKEVIDVLRGFGGYRGNQFMRGYFLGSLPDSSFAEYVGRMLGAYKSTQITSEVVADRLALLKIQSLSFNSWEGCDQDDLVKRVEVQQEIDRRRSARGTYKHDRQTQAEAEVAIIVDGVRSGKLQPPEAKAQDAFFISSTRVVDRLPNLERRICLFPEGLAQWLWSAQAISPRHAELVFQQLLWELARGGVEFVDRATLLQRFSGIIEAAETDLRALISGRQEHLVEKYGPNPASAFTDADPLDFQRLTTEVQQEALTRMQKALDASEKREREARSAGRMSEKERKELVRLQQIQREKRLKAQRKRRAAQSRLGKKRRRRKKNG